MGRDLDVVVAIPGPDMWYSNFAISLIGMVSDFTQAIPGYTTQRLRFYRKVGSLLPTMRQKMMDEALKQGATHLFFVDADQSFPSNALRRLLSHRVPIVGCNVAVKKFPSSSTARAFDPDNSGGRIVYTTEKSRGLERVWRFGTGVMLIDLSICRYLGPRPWFNIRWKEDADEFEGEDWFFLSVVEKAGYHIYIDHELSWQVGHMGALEYKHDFVVAARVYADMCKQDAELEVTDLAASGKIAEVSRGGNGDESRKGQASDEQWGGSDLQVRGGEGSFREDGSGCETRLEAHREEREVKCQEQ